MAIFDGFASLFGHANALWYAILGSCVGLVAGAIPGLSAAAAIALLMPLTYYLEPLSALVFIYTISKAASFGGSIPAILFNTPGTAAAAATQIEGYPLTRQGKQGKALRMAVIASAAGDTSSELLLIFGAAYIAFYTRALGPPEYFAVYCCAFVIIGSVIGQSIIKGVLSTLLGILLSTVGLDPITAEPRFLFGMYELMGGLALVPVLLGVFVLSEVFVQVVERESMRAGHAIAPASRRPEDNRVTWPELRTALPVMARSTGLGTLIGLLPGVGASVACFVGYAEAKRTSKYPERWGTGVIEGVAATEAANNSVSGANLIPLLSLGIPGSTTAALLAGVFLIHGINIGPRVFVESYDLVYGLFAAGLLCILIYFLIGYFGSGLIGRSIAVVPARLIYPFIFIMAFVAAYAARTNLHDVVVMCVFGLVGFLMKRSGFSPPAFVIAFILGPGAEETLRQSLLLSQSGYWIFMERPLAVAFLLLGLMVCGIRVVALLRGRGTNRAPASAPREET